VARLDWEANGGLVFIILFSAPLGSSDVHDERLLAQEADGAEANISELNVILSGLVV
jgi:hypothetical protein